MDGFETSVNLATALQAYALRKTTDVGAGNVDKLIQMTNLRKASFDKLFPAMFSLHGLDIKIALDRAVKDKDITENAAKIAIFAINSAMADMANRYPVLDTATFNTIKAKIQDLIAAFNLGGIDMISSDKVTAMDKHMGELKIIFKQPFIVSYFKGDTDRVASLKIAHNSFSNLRDIVNKRIKEQVASELTNNNVTNSKLRDSNFLTTKIINWGHTQTNNSIITGKLLAEFMSTKNVIKNISSNQDTISLIVKDFLQETGQEKTVIKLHQGELTKGSANILNLVIESGIFQTVVVQNRRENQEDLGQLEKKWNIVDAISRNGLLLKAFEVKSLSELASKLLRVRSSPSMIEKLERTLVNTLSGDVIERTEKTITLLNTSVKQTKRKKQITVKNNVDKGGLRVDTTPSIPSITNLDSLMSLINRGLEQQIQRNMGTGDSTRVLNYRTGRFAASAKVERMSESRQGMITAFYSYMRNPYGTFAEGGAQEFPASRNPKTLIARSIRELAGTQVANRMRAILV